MEQPQPELTITPYDRDEDPIEATTSDQQGRLRVRAASEVAVVLGRGSKPARELDAEACLEDEVLVQRRRGGGRAVVIDPGNVIVSVALPIGGFASKLTWECQISVIDRFLP